MDRVGIFHENQYLCVLILIRIKGKASLSP